MTALAPGRDRLGDRHGHPAVLERPGRVGALDLEVDVAAGPLGQRRRRQSGVPPSQQRDHPGVRRPPAAGPGTPRSRRGQPADRGRRDRHPASVAADGCRAASAIAPRPVDPHHRGAPPRTASSSGSVVDGGGQRGVRARVGDQHQRRVVAAARLPHRRDGHPVRRRTPGDRRQHARPVGHVEADVVAGRRTSPIGRTGRSAYADSPGAAAAGEPVAGHRDQVAEHGGRGRRTAGARAVEHQLAGRLRLDVHRVERAAARRPAGGCAGSSPGARGRADRAVGQVPLADRQQLDRAAHRLRARRCRRRSPRRCPRGARPPRVTRVWKASPARIAALAAASKPVDVGGRVGLGVARARWPRPAPPRSRRRSRPSRTG